MGKQLSSLELKGFKFFVNDVKVKDKEEFIKRINHELTSTAASLNGGTIENFIQRVEWQETKITYDYDKSVWALHGAEFEDGGRANIIKALGGKHNQDDTIRDIDKRCKNSSSASCFRDDDTGVQGLSVRFTPPSISSEKCEARLTTFKAEISNR